MTDSLRTASRASHAIGVVLRITLALVITLAIPMSGAAQASATTPVAVQAAPIVDFWAGEWHSLGLRSDGTVVAVGKNEEGQCNVEGWTDIVALSGGYGHSVGLKSDGTVVATGRNDYGQCNVGTWTDIVAIDTRIFHTVGVKSDGTVVATGWNRDGQCDVGAWTDIVSVAAGHYHTIGLKSDGTVVAAGSNFVGQSNVYGWTGITKIGAGLSHSVGLKADGTVVGVGSGSAGLGELAGWTQIADITQGGVYTIGLLTNGTLVGAGQNLHGELNFSAWQGVQKVAAGGFHTLAMRADGIIVGIGNNDWGQCDFYGDDPGDPTDPTDPGDEIPVFPSINIGGGSRYETAVKASQEAYPTGAATVVIATGRNWPDALGGSALAGVLDAPILLVSTHSIPAEVTAEISRLRATRAVIVGGPAAVGPAVENALRSSGLTVERVAGGSRYETADRVALRVIAERGTAFDGTAFVATGGAYADAVAAGPLAAAQGWPIYLAHPSSGLSSATQTAMSSVSKAIVLGGNLAVSPAVESGLRTRLGAGNVSRLAGESRYATAVAIANYGVQNAGLSWDRAGIATGQAFPDALAGGVLQGKMRSVMLLTRTGSLEPVTRDALVANRSSITKVTFFGGLGAISQAVRDAVSAALAPATGG